MSEKTLQEKRLYELVGDRIRQTRERSQPRISQSKLAATLGLSRTSIVNIKAGRQHPPLHVIWQIAEALGTDCNLLIPNRRELIDEIAPIVLDEETAAQLEREINDDPHSQRVIRSFISKVRSQNQRI